MLAQVKEGEMRLYNGGMIDLKRLLRRRRRRMPTRTQILQTTRSFIASWDKRCSL